MRYIILFFVICFSFNISFAKEVIKFHKPETEAEMALDNILKNNDKLNLFYCITIYNGTYINNKETLYVDAPRNIIYNFKYKTPDSKKLEFCNQFFTQSLMQKASQKERESCDNQEFDPYCWIGCNPIDCRQESHDEYLYYAVYEDEKNAKINTIGYDLESDNKHIIQDPPELQITYSKKYHMFKENNTWKMNNNSCIQLNFTN